MATILALPSALSFEPGTLKSLSLSRSALQRWNGWNHRNEVTPPERKIAVDIRIALQ
jgi:hypothetical protein